MYSDLNSGVDLPFQSQLRTAHILLYVQYLVYVPLPSVLLATLKCILNIPKHRQTNFNLIHKFLRHKNY